MREQNTIRTQAAPAASAADAVHPQRAAAGRAGRAASPWNRSAHATTARARQSFIAYCKQGQQMRMQGVSIASTEPRA